MTAMMNNLTHDNQQDFFQRRRQAAQIIAQMRKMDEARPMAFKNTQTYSLVSITDAVFGCVLLPVSCILMAIGARNEQRMIVTVGFLAIMIAVYFAFFCEGSFFCPGRFLAKLERTLAQRIELERKYAALETQQLETRQKIATLREAIERMNGSLLYRQDYNRALRETFYYDVTLRVDGRQYLTSEIPLTEDGYTFLKSAVEFATALNQG